MRSGGARALGLLAGLAVAWGAVELLRAAPSGPVATQAAGLQRGDPAPDTPLHSLSEDVITMKRLTPVLPVQAIEPILPFWDKLGFERSNEVPHGDGLGFVILQKDDVQVMYQTYASIADDVPSLAETPAGGTLLFIEVEDLDAVAAALEGIEPVIPRRMTFYGADELVVREPGGNIVTFAQFGREGG